MKIELRDREYFAVIAEAGNIGRAAEKLNLSQPALSLSLRRLERATHSKIVARTPKGVDLTAAGTALLSRVEKLRLAHEDVVREVSEIGHGLAGHVRIGIGTAWPRGLGRACSELINAAPKVTLSIQIGPVQELLQVLKKGELDFVIQRMGFADNECVEERLYEDEFIVYASARHRLARRRQVALAELAEARWAGSLREGPFQHLLERECAARNLPAPQVVITSMVVEVRLMTVANTDLLGYGSRRLVEQSAFANQLKTLPVKGIKWRRTGALIYRKGAYLSPAVRRLIELLKAASAEEN